MSLCVGKASDAELWFFSLRLNKRLSKISWGSWFETLSRLLWRHCNMMLACCWELSVLLAFVRGIHRRLLYHWLNETIMRHYSDVIMGATASHFNSLTIVYSTVYSGAEHRKHRSSTPLAFVWGIYRDRWIPAQKVDNAEKVSIWWRHHDNMGNELQDYTKNNPYNLIKIKVKQNRIHTIQYKQLTFEYKASL